jgi:glycerol-3-phosphate acyltransferase PlsX
MRIALDAMGGDNAPGAIVEGAVRYARANPFHEVVLVGDHVRVSASLSQHALPSSNLAIRHASQVVEMDDEAGASIRRKQDSSLRVALQMVRSGEASAFVSAGHSGAALAGALLVLGRLPGVERPAIAALLPALRKGRCLLLDAGANVECRPSQLAQWAVMGEAYVRTLLSVHRPRVAILSNGEEESKGTSLTRESATLLRKSDLNFVGYAEGKDIFSGDVDVVVTDGFTGNVVLKTAEGTALGVVGLIKQAIDKSPLPERVGALLMKPTLLGLRKVLDYAEYGGAPLLGVAGVGIVAHGRSDAQAIFSALHAAHTTVEARLQSELARSVERAGQWLPKRGGRKGMGATEEPLSD